MTNIGRNPTVGDHNELRIETHVVEFSGDLYDRMITVRIYQRLRDEHKFASLEEVKAQVMKDQEKAMAYFKEHHI
ncbi:MAG: riboflavin kinase [Coprococcus sp.]